MFIEKDLKIIALSGNSGSIKFGTCVPQSNWDDDDDYDCACCIGGFSK